jgi:hypothetical protein
MTGDVLELPDLLPNRAPEMPREVVGMLMDKLWKKHLMLQEGINGVIESLYRGELRGTERDDAVRVSYLAPASACWPFVKEDTQHYVATREAARLARQAAAASSASEISA